MNDTNQSIADLLNKYHPGSVRQVALDNQYLRSTKLIDIVNDPQGVFEEITKLPGVSTITISKLKAALATELLQLSTNPSADISAQKLLSTRDSLLSDGSHFKILIDFSPNDTIALKTQAYRQILKHASEYKITFFSANIPDFLKTEPVWRLFYNTKYSTNHIVDQRKAIPITQSWEHPKFIRYMDADELYLLKYRGGRYSRLSQSEADSQLEILKHEFHASNGNTEYRLLRYHDVAAAPAAIAHGKLAYVAIAGGYIRTTNKIVLSALDAICARAEQHQVNFNEVIEIT